MFTQDQITILSTILGCTTTYGYGQADLLAHTGGKATRRRKHE